MPMMETGRGAEPGLSAAACRGLRVRYLVEHRGDPVGRERLPEAGQVQVGDVPEGGERRRDGAGEADGAVRRLESATPR